MTALKRRVYHSKPLVAASRSIRSSFLARVSADLTKSRIWWLTLPEFLTQKSGTKEGQVQMIRESNGSVTAHTWSTAANQWINVGKSIQFVVPLLIVALGGHSC